MLLRLHILAVAAMLALAPAALAQAPPVQGSPATPQSQAPSSAPRPEAIPEVTGDHLEQTARCDKGAPLRILANDSRLSVVGNCTVVTVVGSRNWMTVQHARRIITTGDRNTVLYDDRASRVDDRGKANSVAVRWPQ